MGHKTITLAIKYTKMQTIGIWLFCFAFIGFLVPRIINDYVKCDNL